MLGMLQGAPSVEELQHALEDRDAEIEALQAQLKAHQESDQRDFLMDNSDQLTAIINTKNQVIHDLQAQLQALQGASSTDGGGPAVSAQALAQALENVVTTTAELDRLRGHARKLEDELKSSEAKLEAAKTARNEALAKASTAKAASGELEAQKRQLQLYEQENARQAAELASIATNNAMEVGRLQASLAAMTERCSHFESKAEQTAGAVQAPLGVALPNGPPPVAAEVQELQQAILAARTSLKAERDQRAALEAKVAAHTEELHQKLAEQAQDFESRLRHPEASMDREASHQAELVLAERKGKLDNKEEELQRLQVQLQEMAQAARVREEEQTRKEAELSAREQTVRETLKGAEVELSAREASLSSREQSLEQRLAQDSVTDSEVDERIRRAEARENAVAAQEQEAAKLIEERERALALRETSVAELVEVARQQEAAQAAQQSQDAKVRGCFEAELEEQKQLVNEREQALLEQERALEKAFQETDDKQALLAGRNEELENQRQRLQAREESVRAREEATAAIEQSQSERQQGTSSREQALLERDKALAERERKVLQRELIAEREADAQGTSGASTASPLGARVAALTDTVSELTEALERVRESERGAAERCDSYEEQIKELKKQLHAAKDGVGSEEARRLHQELQDSRIEVADAKRAALDASSKAHRFEMQLSRLRVDEEASQQRQAQVNAKGVAPTTAMLGSGGLAGMIAATLQDVELGERSGVTLVDLGLADFAGLPEVDKFLQLISALMSVRADARLTIFGLWALCHLIYVLYLVYAHLVR